MSISNRQHLAALDEQRAIIRRQESEIYALRDLLRSLAPKAGDGRGAVSPPDHAATPSPRG